MSRDDPQLRIRLPIELKEKIELAAKVNTRSMNAEIVQRLEISFLNEITIDDSMSANEVMKIANKAKEELSNVIYKRTFDEINRLAKLGQMTFFIGISDLELDNINRDDFPPVFSRTFKKLEELGYKIVHDRTDFYGFTLEIPNQ